MNFKLFANTVKDAALQHLAKWFANRYHLRQMGRITDLRVDSSAQVIVMELDLIGEQLPVELTVHYRVVSPTLLQIEEVKSSRQWIAALVNEVIPKEEKCLEVPAAVTRALSKLEL